MEDSTEPTPVRRARRAPRSAPGESMPDLHLRAPDPAICPFFRSQATDGRLEMPIAAPDDANRCAAFGEPWPQSHRQQELVCLTAAHTGCPRYLRGSLAEVDEEPSTDRRTMTPAVLASILLLVATMAAAIAFVFARGGLDLPAPAPTDVAAVPSPTSAAATAGPASPSPLPSPSATPAPSAEPTPGATPVPTPAPTIAPSPTSDRYALLEPCPNTPDCWIYTVRAGDNLTSIANYFGVPLATVYELNPEMRTRSLQPGKKLILPPPTR